MNAPMAFHLAHEALSGRGASPPEPPKRRAGRLSRGLLLATAVFAILLATLGANARAYPARGGATAQPGGDRFAGVASAQKKRSADKQRGRGKRGAKKKGGSSKAGAKKKGGKPGAKKKGGKPGGKKKGGKKGAKKKGGKKKGGKKGGGKPGGRGRPTDPHTLFYTAELEGRMETEIEFSGAKRRSEIASTSLRAARPSVQLSRAQLTDPNTNETIHYYDLELNGEGELFNGSSTHSDSAYTTDDGTECSAESWTSTEPGPSPFEFSIGAALGLPGNNATIYAKRLGGSGTVTYSGSSCTTPDGRTHTIEPRTFATDGVGEFPSFAYRWCQGGEPPSGWTATSVARGNVVWGRPFTINVICTTDSSLPGNYRFAGTRLTITMTPCPGRATRPCQ